VLPAIHSSKCAKAEALLPGKKLAKLGPTETPISKAICFIADQPAYKRLAM
jgi:hypothetical protein